MQNKRESHTTTESFVRRYRPIFAGLFAVIPILTIPALLVFAALKSDSLQKWRAVHIFYENSYGLKKGNQVSISGIAIGHIKEVDLVREKRVHVCINVNDRYKHLVKKDTKARMKQRGFVGDWEIELFGGSDGAAYAEENDTLKTEKTSSLDDLIELAGGIIDTGIVLLGNIAAIARGIEAGDGTIGQLLKNDSIFMLINRYVDQIGANAVSITSNVKKISADAQGTVRHVDTMLLSFTDVGRGGVTVIDTITTLINTIDRSINEIELILKNARTVSDNAPELLDRLQHDLGEIELMLRSFQEGWLFKSVGGGGAAKNPHLLNSP